MATAVKDRSAGLVHTHVITGWPDQVHAALERAQADGRLVEISDVTELPDRQVQVNAQLRDEQPRRTRWSSRLRWPEARVWAGIGAGVLGVGAVAGAVWAVVAAVSALITQSRRPSTRRPRGSERTGPRWPGSRSCLSCWARRAG
ncbi:hypothetical protein BJF90_16530 [Pseudonocardia sp. CNS-004]|nr:hypothetical protein BJF90_16530 [Pseudonocardia sp. CNS-004]